jgi:LacI family transcriptional regulator, galactose operon repressor
MKKPPTVHDVANLSGVSTATVSRYFNGKEDAISPKTLEKVKRAVNELGYTPSEVGRSLRLARSRVVAMLVPDATNFFTADVAVSVENALQESGRSLVLANTDENGDKQDRLLSEAVGMRAETIVLQGGIDTPLLRNIVKRQGNCIFVNRRPPADVSAPYVGTDNFSAGREVGNHFRKRGYTGIVAIHGPKHYPGSSSRLEGFLAGCDSPENVVQLECAYTMEAGYELGLELLQSQNQNHAIFCANDMIAYGVHRAATERGLNVPEQIKLFGFDGNRVNDWLAPWLSTVKVRADLYGPSIAKFIIDGEGKRFEPDAIVLPFELILRDSA